MSRNSVLIFGGSHSEIPLIRAARQLGLTVFTSGNRPDHPGHALADHYFPGDFSNSDQMTEVAERSRCDFIVSAANDYAYLSACTVAEKLGFPGFDPLETAEALHHKHRFKQLAAALGLPATRFITLEAGINELPANHGLRYPLVVKPVDLTGGKGISIVETVFDLPNAITVARKLSKQGALVIEEYFDGSLHSYSTIIANGRVVFDYADDEYCLQTPYLVSASTSIVSVPLHILTDLKHQAEKLAKHLNLVDGILHCQFLYKSGNYVILEYTRRCSGDLYSEVVEAVTGIKHAEQFIRCSATLDLNISYTRTVSDFIGRHCVFSLREGSFNGIEISSSLKPWVKSITEAVPRGYLFNDNRLEKAAVVILQFPTRGDMLRIRPEMNAHIKCDTVKSA